MSLGTPKFQGKKPRNRGNFLIAVFSVRKSPGQQPVDPFQMGGLRRISPKMRLPKKIRERSRVYLGTASSRISPKVSLPEKNSGRLTFVFGGCVREFPKVSLSEKKFGNVPECFWGTFFGKGLDCVADPFGTLRFLEKKGHCQRTKEQGKSF